jgi:hypothetical protein
MDGISRRAKISTVDIASAVVPEGLIDGRDIERARIMLHWARFLLNIAGLRVSGTWLQGAGAAKPPPYLPILRALGRQTTRVSMISIVTANRLDKQSLDFRMDGHVDWLQRR